MTKSSGRFFFFISLFLCCGIALLFPPNAFPQQTLGGITGVGHRPIRRRRRGYDRHRGRRQAPNSLARRQPTASAATTL